MTAGSDTPLRPGALRDALARAMEEERAQASVAAANVRGVISVSVLVLLVLAWELHRSAWWEVYLAPVAMHAAASGVAYLLRHRPFAKHLAPALAVIDAGLVLAGQARALPVSSDPLGIAGFSVGLFAMVIVLNGLTLRPSAVLVATVVGLSGEALLMKKAAVHELPAVVFILSLVVVAGASVALMHRMRKIVARFAAAEIAREIERRNSAEQEAARRDAESVLHESREKNDRLERLQKDKESLTELLVHDLRSPITVVVGYVDLVRNYLEQAQAPLAYRQALDQALGTAMRLNAMTSDILQISKLEEGRLVLHNAYVDARTLVEELAEEARALAAPRGVQVEVVALDEAPLSADFGLLRRVLENLVTNALRFTPPEKRLRISVEASEDEVRLIVQNEGASIDPAQREQLFDKYQQGRDARAGWGLGLYFCRLAVEAHGGSIAIEDREPFNTSFVIRLPKRTDSRPAPSVQAA